MKRPRSKASSSPVPNLCAPVSPVAKVVQRGYDTDDRFFKVLLMSLCRSMGMEAHPDPTSPRPILLVTGDTVTQDLLEKRMMALSQKLDDKLMALCVDFIREHCGIEVPIRPRD